MVDIIVTTYFRLEFTKKTIKYLFDRTTSGSFRLIVIDNGSTDGTREWLLENIKPPHLVILINQNLGLQQAKNVAMNLVSSELFVDTDNDILCPLFLPTAAEGWLPRLTRLMKDNPEFAAIALRPQILVGVGDIFKGKGEAVENNVCGGSLRLMRTNAVRKAGGWKNAYENRAEEWEICGRLKKDRWKVGYARDIFCFHLFGDGENGVGRWGYDKGIDHSHRTDTTPYIDSKFCVDPNTLVPKQRHNE